MKAKFFICRHCGNIITMMHNAGVPVVCCGEKMEALVPNSTEAAGEKHLPVVTLKDGAVYVNVGSVNHPMLDEHFIEWIYLETENGGQFKYITLGEAPEAVFAIGGDKPVAAYAYCNLHGLWVTEI